MIKQLKLIFFPRKKLLVRKLRRTINRRKKSDSTIPEPSSEELILTWRFLISQYFPDRFDLIDYRVTWSKRKQKRVLASCNIRNRRIVVAQELLEPEAKQWIEAVLYHELCHAVIGENVHKTGRKRLWHGAEFKALEAKHPDIESLKFWIASGGWAMAVRSNRIKAL